MGVRSFDTGQVLRNALKAIRTQTDIQETDKIIEKGGGEEERGHSLLPYNIQVHIQHNRIVGEKR